MSQAFPPVRASLRGANPARLYRDILDPYLRRALDVAAAVAGLVVLSPLMGTIALAVRVQDGGPALYRAWRVGKDGMPFRLYKFRTMVTDAEQRKQ